MKKELIPPIKDNGGNFVVDDVLGLSLLIAANFKKSPQKLCILTTNLYNSQKVYDLLSTFIGEDNCLFFPCDELLRTEKIASSKEMLSQRLFVLHELLKDQKKIIIAHTNAVSRYLPSPNLFSDSSITIKKGDKFQLSKLVTKLASIGYIKVNKIDSSLQFALRGDILDIFSVNYPRPIRIEFFDDEVESVKFFDIPTQLSSEPFDKVEILPGTDLLFTGNEERNFEDKINKQVAKDGQLLGEKIGDLISLNTSSAVEDLKMKSTASYLYKYYSFIQDNHYSLLDYIKGYTLVIANIDDYKNAVDINSKEARDFLDEQLVAGQIISHLEIFNNTFDEVLKWHPLISCSYIAHSPDDVHFNVRPIAGEGTSVVSGLKIVEQYLETDEKVVLCFATKQQEETFITGLDDKQIEYEVVEGLSLPKKKKVGISIYSLQEGFEFTDYKIAFISSKELFGYKNHSSRFLGRFKEAVILKSYEDLKPGDYVVHEQNGIGQFVDIITMDVEGNHQDFLKVQYAGTDVLYVPLYQFKLIRKFSAREGARPKLNKLFSSEWEKTKSKIKNRVNLLADRLMKLYEERAKVQGYAFKKDDEIQEIFEKQFPFELTSDQEKACKEIKEDMEKPTPMDRLLCGDVGFGKTEVAFRAAFKAISNGKQVAILCPTTLLARQHYEVAVERFSSFGIRIAIFSRLIPAARQNKYIEEVQSGKINLVIGTHRLLSKSIVYKDLGLLIVDEEQRFGVEQKEKIKEIKSNVDVLTLSATPIPRTLQISLLGIRGMSQINTAPTNRNPIQTYVTAYDERVIKELLERELARNGQTFYVYNTVSAIYSKAARLQRMIPNANIGVVHGQMEKNEIEDVMLKFYNNEIQILVCSSIIENGIDVANANLIIVENAEFFGLSQLYQIKGRVGRGNRIAYAYLMYRPQKTMTEEAQKRLKAIQDFTELGSGYKIAQRDLMIRGAGDILGPEQAGFIDSIGLDMYLKLLSDAIETKKNPDALFVDTTKKENQEKSFQIDAYIPDSYADKSDKIELYQELEEAKTIEDIDTISQKIRDIYGRVPVEVQTLFLKKKVDIYSTSDAFEKITERPKDFSITLSLEFSQRNGIGNDLFNALVEYLKLIKVSFLERKITIRLTKVTSWIKYAAEIMNICVKLYEKNETKGEN